MSHHFAKLSRMFATRDAQLDYGQLQWQRGVFAGMKFLLDTPTIEALKLERLLKQEEVNESA